MYVWGQERLGRAGFRQYELSNFCLPGRACRHNKIYWEYQPYLGLGSSAHSFVRGRRSWNEADPEAYCLAMEIRGAAEAGSEDVGREKRLGERLMLGLRQTRGIRKRAFFRLAGPKTGGYFQKTLRSNRKLGLLEETPSHYRLTPQGMLLSNRVFRDILL
jgi:oxygen-independent coproporphyrinogen-3 oxidase